LASAANSGGTTRAAKYRFIYLLFVLMATRHVMTHLELQTLTLGF
jgi:hypothetical protein